MADRMADKPSSSSSSVTEHDSFHDPEKSGSRDSDDGRFALKTPDELEKDNDFEREGLLPEEEKAPAPPTSTARSSLIWMVVNTLATIGIVCYSSSISDFSY